MKDGKISGARITRGGWGMEKNEFDNSLPIWRERGHLGDGLRGVLYHNRGAAPYEGTGGHRHMVEMPPLDKAISKPLTTCRVRFAKRSVLGPCRCLTFRALRT